MENHNCSLSNEATGCSFHVVGYGDKYDNTLQDIFFVNSSHREIKCLKVHCKELHYNKVSEGMEVLAQITYEYVGISPGESLFLEKLYITDDVDGYRYDFVLEMGEDIINISCFFRREELLIKKGVSIPLIEDLCA